MSFRIESKSKKTKVTVTLVPSHEKRSTRVIDKVINRVIITPLLGANEK